MPLTIDEFLARPTPEHKWIVEELLPANGGLIIHGLPGVGKSLFALGLVASVAAGEQEFLDFTVFDQGRSLYVQTDTSDTIWNEYLTRARDLYPMEHIYFSGRWEMPNFKLDLTKKSDLTWLLETVQKVDPKTVVLDVLASMHSADENKPFEMQRVVEALQQIKRLGPALILLAHSNKPSATNMNTDGVNGVRGASNVAGAMDVVIHLTGPKIENRTLHMDKVRAPSKHREGLKLFQDPKTGLYQVKSSPSLVYNRLTAKYPAATVKEMTDMLLDAGVSKSHAHRLINGKPITED